MRAKVSRGLLAVWILFIFVSAGWDAFAGSKASRETASESGRAVTSGASTQLSGQELWSMNCQRCHNMRSPVMYSSGQWEIIVHHMRIRANITGADQRAITDFLKSVSP